MDFYAIIMFFSLVGTGSYIFFMEAFLPTGWRIYAGMRTLPLQRE